MDHYPLIIVTVHNRKAETEETLLALSKTVSPGEAHIVLIDNASSDGAADVVKAHHLYLLDHDHDTDIYLMEKNLGCPAALNMAMEMHRWAGQPVVKIDNDVRLERAGWVQAVGDLVDRIRENRNGLFRGPPALVGAIVGEVKAERLAAPHPLRIDGGELWLCNTVIGHAVWHDGAFLDGVGYFDVLGPGHLYGFEDLLMGYKARALGWTSALWSGWEVTDLQRHSAMSRADQYAHVAEYRTAYDERVKALTRGGSIWTDPLGRPAERPWAEGDSIWKSPRGRPAEKP